MFELLMVVHLAALVLVNFKSPAATVDETTSKFDAYYSKFYPYVRLVAGLWTKKVDG